MNEKKSSNLHKDPRHLARILAVQYLFTKLKAKKSNIEFANFESNYLLDELEEKKYSTKLYEEIVDGVEEHEKELDEVIQKHAPAWPIDQINPVDLVILRVAVWESKFKKDTPIKVVINEAIEISKIISSDQSGKFINGVLGAMVTDTISKDE